MNAFDKVIGYEELKEDLIKVCDVLKDPERYMELGVNMPRGLLLYGEPGVGKTLISTCFIEGTGRNAFTVRKDKPDGDFIYEINEVFEKAKECAPSIVFLDDFDKFAKEDSYESSDDEEYVAVQTCMDKLSDEDVFVVATVNRVSRIPNSMLRPGRFDKVLEVGKPSKESTEKIISYYLKSKKIAKDVDIEEIARIMENRSCAELRSVANEAGINAGYREKKVIEHQDILKACLRILLNSSEVKKKSSAKKIRYVALHEAGHVVAGEILKPGCVNIVSLSKGGIGASGKTIYGERGDIVNYSEIKDEVIRLLAGKAAIEVEYGMADTGAVSDIESAFNIIKRALNEVCPVGWDTWKGDEFMDSWWVNNAQHKTTQEIENCYQEAKKILIKNRQFLIDVADELMDRHTLTYKDIARLREKRIYHE